MARITPKIYHAEKTNIPEPNVETQVVKESVLEESNKELKKAKGKK